MPDRIYTTEDKTTWGDGPWQDEPDKKQWTDQATGLPCLIVRGPSGALCGYVGIDPDHPLYEVSYDEHDDDYNYRVDISIHGGLTYSDHCAEGDEDKSICHIPEPGQPDKVWWFGFDCAHSGDVSPASDARLREIGHPAGRSWETYRTIDYVEREVTRLADQLQAVKV